MIKVQNSRNYSTGTGLINAVYAWLVLIQPEDGLYPNHTTGHADVLKHMFRPILISKKEPLKNGDLAVMGNESKGYDLFFYDEELPQKSAKKVIATWNHISQKVFDDIMNKRFEKVLVECKNKEVLLDNQGYVKLYHIEINPFL